MPKLRGILISDHANIGPMRHSGRYPHFGPNGQLQIHSLEKIMKRSIDDRMKYTNQTVVLNHTFNQCANIIIPSAKRIFYARNNVSLVKFTFFQMHVDR